MSQQTLSDQRHTMERRHLRSLILPWFYGVLQRTTDDRNM